MKYKNKGFTLIEILAVVTIIGLIFILVIPKITTSLKNKKSDVDKTTENLEYVSFNKLSQLQKLIKKESSLKNLCK
jgi:prepilin-type N-terminal cleavage/methylation domain-containing protein